MMPAPPPAAPPPPPPAEMVQKVAKVIPRQFADSRLMAPRAVPEKIALIVEEELPPAVSGVVGGVEGGVPGGMLHGVIGAVVDAASSHAAVLPPPPPPPVVVKRPTPPQRIKVGGNVQEAKLIRRVIPSYPLLARQARVGGIVQLIGVITKEGVVAQLQVVSGHPLLVGAALDAVRQWVYEPTLLNGDKVEVIAPITVNFILQ
ncbi:MAG: energy transducer TonB, partial [Bryobacteraceae bacterium]|nr:energy transducer TonB [Bryobacteraceae bacterium]